MKAIAVIPGERNSIHLEEIPQPSLDDVSAGKGVLGRFSVSASTALTRKSTTPSTAPLRRATPSW
jgi:hypothetical protein